jgi:hypothetical protein
MLLHETSFELDGMDADEAARLVLELAPRFAAMPGLVHKVWTREGARFGGVYLWRDRASLDDFRAGPLHPSNVPAFTDLRERTLGVVTAPTAITVPGAAPLATA